MIEDVTHGKRDKRGNWTPNDVASVAPIWKFPPRIGEILRWIPGYFFPYNFIWLCLSVAYWYVLIPDQAVLTTIQWEWSLRLLGANILIVLLIYGALEVRLYARRRQGTRFKYNARFPSETKSNVFWFKSQNIDNAIRTFFIGLPIWTALEVIFLWAYANGIGNWLALSDHPTLLIALMLVVPVIHETHFYLIHRLIHTRFLYKWVHSVHHNSNNPSPWSSLSMHPVEHLLYFSSIFYHLFIPSNPILAIYQINFAGFGAFVGHIGFHKIELNEKTAVDSHAYIHYLHHKYFEVNYGDGLVPFDKLLGTFHDGSKEADELMKARFRKKKEKLNAAKS